MPATVFSARNNAPTSFSPPVLPGDEKNSSFLRGPEGSAIRTSQLLGVRPQARQALTAQGVSPRTVRRLPHAPCTVFASAVDAPAADTYKEKRHIVAETVLRTVRRIPGT